MGKITDAKNRFNNESTEINKHKSKKRNIRSFKDYASLLAPNAQKRFSLSPKLRKLQVKGRLTVAAIAAALAISGGTAIAHNSNSINNEHTIETQVALQSDELLNEAENKLLQYVFGENLENVNNPKVKYIAEKDGYVIKVTSGKDEYAKIKYLYSETLSFDGILNNKQVVKLINNMIDVYRTDTPSQNLLQDLDENLKNLEGKNFKLNDKGYIVEANEKEIDYERD